MFIQKLKSRQLTGTATTFEDKAHLQVLFCLSPARFVPAASLLFLQLARISVSP